MTWRRETLSDARKAIDPQSITEPAQVLQNRAGHHRMPQQVGSIQWSHGALFHRVLRDDCRTYDAKAILPLRSSNPYSRLVNRPPPQVLGLGYHADGDQDMHASKADPIHTAGTCVLSTSALYMLHT